MKITHLFFTAVLAMLVPLCAVAQAEQIQALETELTGASGVARVETLLKLSEAYEQAGDTKKALRNAEEATDLARRIRRPEYEAIALNREGKILALTGKKGLFGKDLASAKFRESTEILRRRKRLNKELALENLVELRKLAERNGRQDDIAEIDNQIAQINALLEELPAPVSPMVLEQPLTKQEAEVMISAMTDKFLEQQKSLQTPTNRRLNYERERQQMEAQLAEQEKLIDQMTENQLKASLLLVQHRQQLDSLEHRAELDSKNVEIAELALRESESKRNFYLAAFVAMLLLSAGAVYSFLRARQNARVLSEKNKIIRAEQERSENLLLNILPALVAEELKKQGQTSARYFEDVSVLFADFVGFSKIAEKLTPQQLVSELDTCFKAFDDIISKYKLEKIKTIGDAYMVAGGLPNGTGSQLRDMINAAREMQAWLALWNIDRTKQGLPAFEARIGIHSGPVVAGVVGSRKFAFDIWGDTVNIAARIEEASEGGKINISGEVYEVVKSYFPCTYRGKIPAKNKGEIDMYFVEN